MKRLALVLVLATACSGSHGKPTAQPTVSPTPSATVDAPTAGPEPTATPTPPVTPTAAAQVGPVGTKVPSGFTPQSATFISDTVGWALGSSACPGGKTPCDVVARTRDGGATWRAIPSPKTSPEHLAQIRFADERNGFITGDQLWATHDGGATWTVVPNEDGTGLAISAGRAWYNVDSHLYSAPVTGGPFTQEPGDHQAGFALHGPLVVSGSYGGGNTLFVQRHGQSPGQIADPCKGDESTVVGLGSLTHWFLVCEGGGGLGHQEKTAYQSVDAGRTWKAAGQPPALTGTDIYVTTDGTFVLDHQEVAVYRGGSWQVSLGTDGGLSEGGFESARLGFAIGGFHGSPNTEMRITRDAGRTWSTVRF